MVDVNAVEETAPSLRVDGEKLDVLLKERSMTLKALAERMGMHYNSLLHIKRTGGTNLGTVGEIAAALDCSPFDLLVAEGYPEPFSLAPASH